MHAEINQCDLQTFLRQTAHIWHDATGRDRDIALTQIFTMFIGQQMDKTYEIVVIIHRFSGPHHNDIRNLFPCIPLNGIDLI